MRKAAELHWALVPIWNWHRFLAGMVGVGMSEEVEAVRGSWSYKAEECQWTTAGTARRDGY